MARILVAEDNPNNLELMTYLLKAFGHEVLQANNGEQAIDVARRERPDLVLMDIQMPVMDGYEAIRRLKESNLFGATPMVAITALAMVGDKEKILQAGFDGYISKPIDPETFVQQLDPYLVKVPGATGRRPTPLRHEADIKSEAPANRPSMRKGVSVLVVDNIPENIQLLRSLLELSGYGVVSAKSAEEALGKLRMNHPDLIVCDVNMPGLTGFDLIRAVKAESDLRDIPFMFISSTALTKDDADLAISLGADKYVTRPIEPPKLLSEIESLLAGSHKVAPNPTILIADDRDVNRELLVKLFTYRGYKTLEARDGLEALEVIKALRPDLVITDIIMPKMDGYDLAKKIREDPNFAHLPVVFYSATYLTEQAQVLAKDAGVKHVLAKPSDPETILRVVDRALGITRPVDSPPLPARFTVTLEEEPTITLAKTLLEKTIEVESITFRLAAIIELGLTLASESDAPKLVQEFTAASRKILGAGSVAVYLLAVGPNPSNSSWTSGAGDESVPPQSYQDLFDEILHDGAPRRLVDFEIAAEGDGRERRTVALLAVPIQAGASVHGCVCFFQKLGAREFSEEDERIAYTLAAVLATIYEKTRLHGKLLEHAKELQAEISERELAQAENVRLRAAIEQSTHAVMITDSAGVIQYINPAFTRMTGYTSEEALNQNPRLLKSGKQGVGVYQELWKTISSSKPWQGEIINRRKDGTNYPEWMTISPVRNQSGQVVNFIAIKQDLTERKRAEEALRDSEERYRLLFEGNPGPMWVYDIATLRFLTVNEAAVQHYGYSNDEFLSMSVKDIRPPEDVPALLDNIAHSKGGLDHAGEWRHRKKDGALIDVEITSHSIDFGGRRAELVLVNDVTDRKRAVELLRLSEERFRKAFDTNPEPVTISTIADGRYIDVNESFLRTMGFHREEIIGHTSKEIGYWEKPEDREKIIREIQQLGRVDGMEINFRTKSGQRRVGLLSAEKIELDNQYCLLAVTKDITERKELEQQFRQAQRMEAVGRLAGGVAHDFNNILTVINGYSEVMLGQIQIESPHKTYLNEIRKAGERAAGLTRQLLAFSRQQVLAPQVLDVNTVIDNVHSMLKRLIGEDIDLVTIPGKDLGRVKADPGQIEQVLLNLAVNARDAMPGGGKLTIETANVDLDESYAHNHVTAVPGPHVMLAVTDSGTGIDTETQKRIFEPFFTTKEKGKGTGLGLSTVYGIVKQSAGHIWVYSELGQGTTFKIYLPRVDAPLEVAESKKTTPEPSVGQETVLVAEDDGPIRLLVRVSLEARGFTVLEAPDGLEALSLAAQHKGTIHLLLTDLVMPEISGRTLSQRLAAMHPETKVLFMSGYTDDAVIRHGGLEAGTAFLQKPFTPDALVRKVREVLDAV
ncbi:MAG TPA: response regulator [Terriglobia bacterium]|nr:response regulator [Terriglobia bacterium]